MPAQNLIITSEETCTTANGKSASIWLSACLAGPALLPGGRPFSAREAGTWPALRQRRCTIEIDHLKMGVLLREPWSSQGLARDRASDLASWSKLGFVRGIKESAARGYAGRPVRGCMARRDKQTPHQAINSASRADARSLEQAVPHSLCSVVYCSCALLLENGCDSMLPSTVRSLARLSLSQAGPARALASFRTQWNSQMSSMSSDSKNEGSGSEGGQSSTASWRAWADQRLSETGGGSVGVLGLAFIRVHYTSSARKT